MRLPNERRLSWRPDLRVQRGPVAVRGLSPGGLRGRRRGRRGRARRRRVFPRLTERQPDQHASEYSRRREEEGEQKRLLAGLLILAGLVQRSTLLAPLPRLDINPFDPEHVAEYFDLVRDDEADLTLGDGSDPLQHLTWNGYRKWLATKLAPGVRVLWQGRTYDKDDTLEVRTGLRTVGNWPDTEELHELAEYDVARRGWRGFQGRLLYMPGQRWSWAGGYQDRRRRVGFLCYAEELLPFDYVSGRVLDHLLADRGQRASYSSFFGKIVRWRARRAKEEAQERPFIDLALHRAGLGEEDRARAERVLRWWKLRTRVNRSIGKDEAKALRMVEAALRRGDDHPDDPEYLLGGVRR